MNNPSETMLRIGQIRIVDDEKDFVWTILGSCVSVIFHIKEKFSIICHAQMPDRGMYALACSDSCPHPCFEFLPDSNDFKYVTCSINYMLKTIREKNIRLGNIHTTLIGGASVLLHTILAPAIGEQNIMKAKELLKRNSLHIDRELIGGTKGYTIWYNFSGNLVKYRIHGSKGKEIL